MKYEVNSNWINGNGKPVKIIANDLDSEYPVVGVIDGSYTEQYTPEGVCSSDRSVDNLLHNADNSQKVYREVYRAACISNSLGLNYSEFVLAKPHYCLIFKERYDEIGKAFEDFLQKLSEDLK